MIYLLKKLFLGDILLIISILLFIFSGYWVISESDDEKASRIYKTHLSLLLDGRVDEAKQLLDRTLEEQGQGEGPLDLIWLPLVHANPNGYVQLFYYVRILKADPEREQTYAVIANLVNFAPEAFQVKKKSLYLSDLAKIQNVRLDFLEKYNLLTIAEQ